MGYERYPRGAQRDNYGRQSGDDHGAGSDYTYSSARNYDAAGAFERGRRDFSHDYGTQEFGNRDYSERGDGRRAGYAGDYGQRDYGGSGYGARDRSGDGRRFGPPRSDRSGREYHGSYASDGRRFEDVGSRRDWDDDNRAGRYGQERARDHGGPRAGYRGAPQGYDYDDRGFFARAGDEVRSWFGDEDAERRREADMRYDEREYGGRWASDRDSDYGNWRSSQIAALDRDYDEYRREHRSKFENEFSSWRTGRQTQRDSLAKVSEHMEVVGSDDAAVGTVDKVRGDRILLTKSDSEAGGRHHSIPSSWIATVDDKVTLTKTADEAKRHWRDEERNSALFNYGDRGAGGDSDRDDHGRMLNKSFSGTY